MRLTIVAASESGKPFQSLTSGAMTGFPLDQMTLPAGAEWSPYSR